MILLGKNEFIANLKKTEIISEMSLLSKNL
jgi:hypothetical protein